MYKSIMNSNEDLPFPDDPETMEKHRLQNAVGRMEHDLFYLYVFLAAQDLSEEACDFLESHSEHPVPFQMHM